MNRKSQAEGIVRVDSSERWVETKKCMNFLSFEHFLVIELNWSWTKFSIRSRTTKKNNTEVIRKRVGGRSRTRLECTGSDIDIEHRYIFACRFEFGYVRKCSASDRTLMMFKLVSCGDWLVWLWLWSNAQINPSNPCPLATSCQIFRKFRSPLIWELKSLEL